MVEPGYNSEMSSPNLVRAILRQPLSLEAETLLFILASALDASLTYFMVEHGEGRFVESNPIAEFFILNWGHHGMVYFKFAMVAFVCVIAQIIAFTRVETARRLLIFATVVVSVVVAYSLVLLQYSKSLPYYD
jgi:riboflavin transporter FmnP